jgi:hypothetical protein
MSLWAGYHYFEHHPAQLDPVNPLHVEIRILQVDQLRPAVYVQLCWYAVS